MPHVLHICSIYFSFTLHDMRHICETYIYASHMRSKIDDIYATMLHISHICSIYFTFTLHDMRHICKTYIYASHMCSKIDDIYATMSHKLCCIYVSYILHTHYMTCDIYVKLTYMLLIWYKYMIDICYMCNIYCNICVIYLQYMQHISLFRMGGLVLRQR